MPIGALLDQWEVYKQFQGISKSAKEYFVDNLIPEVI